MTQEIQLKEKTLANLTKIQSAKSEIEKLFKNEQEKENLLIESLFEQNDVDTEKVDSIELVKDKIIIKYKE